jgi:hypothetical protein
MSAVPQLLLKQSPVHALSGGLNIGKGQFGKICKDISTRGGVSSNHQLDQLLRSQGLSHDLVLEHFTLKPTKFFARSRFGHDAP